MVEKRIEEILKRQKMGLFMLETLLQEEFAALRSRDTSKVSSLEFSIQELTRQLMNEKRELKRTLGEAGYNSLKEFVLQTKGDVQQDLISLVRSMREYEQCCAVQAEQNAELAEALAEQAGKLVKFLHEQLMPKTRQTYSPKGKWHQQTIRASLVRGCL
ncbi:flagellar export chaperone FlgN [Desulfovulcanus sp.]